MEEYIDGYIWDKASIIYLCYWETLDGSYTDIHHKTLSTFVFENFHNKMLEEKKKYEIIKNMEK